MWKERGNENVCCVREELFQACHIHNGWIKVHERKHSVKTQECVEKCGIEWCS